MRILVTSDIHANWYALEAILSKESYERFLFLGDIVGFGPNPRECIRFLLELYEKGVFIGVRGDDDNAVAYGINCQCSRELNVISRITREWSEGVLTGKEIGFLRRLPHKNSFELDGFTFKMVHNQALNLEVLGSENTKPSVDFLLVGHSHRPFIRRIGRTTVINPGSAGQPMDLNPCVSYAIIENGRATIKRTTYDIDKAINELGKTRLPKTILKRITSILVMGGIQR
ncbi:hypothetical protein HRbin37_01884 [bacterium HR37]|nr:hypothetical protein HRbin37_01884 [bacterium HR37]